MKHSVQEIHRERIRCLSYELDVAHDDMEYCIKKVDSELWGCYSDVAKKISSRPHKPSDLLLWTRECRNKAKQLADFYQQLADELDDIEDEVNRDEVANAGY